MPDGSSESEWGRRTQIEVVTGDGSVARLTCRNDAEAVRSFVASNIYRIQAPFGARIHSKEGSYKHYSRYEMRDHDYCGWGPDDGGFGGFHQLFEIFDPPDGRPGIVIYEHSTEADDSFTEWATLEDAKHAFQQSHGRTATLYPTLPGFLRRVVCNAATPWFFAIGDEHLEGNFALARGLQDDPVYRLGAKFVVIDADGIPSVKTCMGTRFIREPSHYSKQGMKDYRIVYWSDGTTWSEGSPLGDRLFPTGEIPPPRPLLAEEEWIADAMRQFQQLLAGHADHVNIDFLNGLKFTGRLVQPKHRKTKYQKAGRYTLQVRYLEKGERKTSKGWVDFTPTPETPDIVAYTQRRKPEAGITIERVEVIGYKRFREEKSPRRRRSASRTKLWAGAFLAPPVKQP